MKRFLTSTAAAVILAGGAYAAGHSATVLDYEFDTTSEVMASNFIGMRVYATEAEFDANVAIADGGETEWDDIGEINDVVLTRDGNVGAIIVGVGGFLGLGEKDVAVNMSKIAFVQDEGDAGDYFLVIKASQASLEGASDFDSVHGEMHAMAEKDKMMDADTMADARPMLTRPDVTRDGFMQSEIADLTSENLTGARVYGINDEDVGEVSELILSDDGKITKAVIDVGGFLGLGEKPVAVTFDELNIQRSDDGGEFRVYIDATQESLEAQPEYTG